MRVPLGHYPGMNKFVLDWMGGEERAIFRLHLLHLLLLGRVDDNQPVGMDGDVPLAGNDLAAEGGSPVTTIGQQFIGLDGNRLGAAEKARFRSGREGQRPGQQKQEEPQRQRPAHGLAPGAKLASTW